MALAMFPEPMMLMLVMIYVFFRSLPEQRALN